VRKNQFSLNELGLPLVQFSLDCSPVIFGYNALFVVLQHNVEADACHVQ
jgi:hypothetical protein